MERSAYKHQIFWQRASFALANVEVEAKEMPLELPPPPLLPLCVPPMANGGVSMRDNQSFFKFLFALYSCLPLWLPLLFYSSLFLSLSLSSLSLLPLSLSPIDSLNKPQKFYNFIMLFFPLRPLYVFLYLPLSLYTSPSLSFALPLPAYP